MAWTRSSGTISQTATEAGYAGAVTAGYMTYVGDAALKVVQIVNTNDNLFVNGTFDDSGWTVLYKSTAANSGGSRFTVGASAIWTSGSEIDGVAMGGAVHIIQNTGISWSVNSQLTTGCQLNWFGVKIIVKGDGFLQLIDNAAGSNTQVLKGLTIDASGSTYSWQMVNIKNSSDSYADLVGVGFTTKGLGAFPSIRSWRASGSGDISVLPDDAAQSGGVGSTNTFAGLSVNFLTAGQRLRLSNHGGKIATYRLENAYVSPARITLSSNPNNNATSHARWFNTISANAVDLSGVAIAGATVIIKNFSVVKASGTTSLAGDYLSALIETYYATVSNGSANVGLDTLTPTVTDGRALDVRIRKAGFVEQTYANNSNIAGKIAKTFALSADGDFTGTASQAAAITGVTFVYDAATGTVAVSTTAAATPQKIYNFWSYWTALSAQMGATLVPMGLVAVNNGVLTIVGSLAAGASISGSGAVTSIAATTITGAANITCLYTSSAGSSARLTLSGLVGASVYVTDASGTQVDFANGVNGSRIVYFAPGLSGTYSWVVERLGYKRQSGTFTPGVGGDFSASLTWIPDTTLTVTDAAVLAAYTTLDNPTQLLDYNAYWRTTAAGIATDKISKNGSMADLGAASLDLSSAALVPLAYSAGTNKFTVATSAFVLGALQGVLTTGTVTALSGVTVSALVEDSAGVRVMVTGLDPSTLGNTWRLGYLTKTAYDARTAGTPPVLWAGLQTLSGTGNSTRLTLTSNTEYVFLRPRIAGYSLDDDHLSPVYLNTGTAMTLAMQIKADADLQGAVIWTLTSADTNYNRIAYAAASQFVEVDNQTGATLSIGFYSGYRALQEIVNSATLAFGLTAPLRLNSTKNGFVIPVANPLKARMTANSTGAVMLAADVAYSDGSPALDRFKPMAGHEFLFLPVPSARFGVDAIQQVQFGMAKEATLVATDAKVTSIKIKTDTLVNTDTSLLATTAQIAVVNANVATRSTLTAADIPAGLTAAQVRNELSVELGRIDVATSTRSTLTAAQIPAGLTVAQIEASTLLAKEATVAAKASQASVTALATAVGAPLQASSYAAPDNAGIAAIKVKTDTLVNTDTSLLATTTQLAVVNANVATRSTLTAADIPAGLTAAQVRNELSVELGRIDVATSTRLGISAYTAPPTPPTAALIATAVRTNLSLELARINKPLTDLSTLKVADLPAGLTPLQATQLASTAAAAQTTNTAVLALRNTDISQLATAAQLTSLGTPTAVAAAVQQAIAPHLATIDAHVLTRSTLTAADLGQFLAEDIARMVVNAPIEAGATLKGSLRIMNAALAGQVRGAGSNIEKFSNLAGTKNVIVSTNDSNGNRRSVTTDLSD